jgi:Domain of unknown function (DUF4352)
MAFDDGRNKMFDIKRRTRTDNPRLTEKMIDTLVRALGVMLLTCAVSSCAHQNDTPSNSPPASSSTPVAAASSQPAAESSVPEPQSSPPKKIFKTGEVVPAGYLGYKVFNSWFTDRLTDKSANAPSANYLYVDLAIVNTDKNERAVAKLNLVDEKGKEYSPSQKAWTTEGSAGQIGKLAPAMSKRAFAIFEAPQGHQYKLKIQGFSATDVVMIELSPLSARPPG